MTVASLPDVPAEIRFADRPSNPLTVVVVRFLVAVGLVLLIAFVVFLGRDGYRDSAGGEISFGDALYYSTVAVTTTGYGDIVPVSPTARWVTILAVTQLRIAFLVLVVSTTVEVPHLAEPSRHSREKMEGNGARPLCDLRLRDQGAQRRRVADHHRGPLRAGRCRRPATGGDRRGKRRGVRGGRG